MMETELKTDIELGFTYRLFVYFEEGGIEGNPYVGLFHFDSYELLAEQAESWFEDNACPIMMMEYRKKKFETEFKWHDATTGAMLWKKYHVEDAIAAGHPIIEH